MGVHALFLMVEIFIGILFVFACTHLRNPRPRSFPQDGLTQSTAKDDQTSSSTPIKRRHSHEEKSVYLSNHHIEEIKVSKRRCSLDRKSHLQYRKRIQQNFCHFLGRSELGSDEKPQKKSKFFFSLTNIIISSK